MELQPFKIAANRIQELVCPSDIARELKIPIPKAIEYIFSAIGHGLIRESDVFFVLARKYASEEHVIDGVSRKVHEKKLRDAVRLMIMQTLLPPLADSADEDEVLLYISYRKRNVYIADMYLFLAALERNLHQRIRSILTQKFGNAETGWWKLGVPENVRIKCAGARELDAKFVAHPYSFTTLIQLKDIICANQNLFVPRLPAMVAKDLKSFYKQLNRLNGIRNQVMHPVREEPPTEQDFEFVREMHHTLATPLWR